MRSNFSSSFDFTIMRATKFASESHDNQFFEEGDRNHAHSLLAVSEADMASGRESEIVVFEILLLFKRFWEIKMVSMSLNGHIFFGLLVHIFIGILGTNDAFRSVHFLRRVHFLFRHLFVLINLSTLSLVLSGGLFLIYLFFFFYLRVLLALGDLIIEFIAHLSKLLFSSSEFGFFEIRVSFGGVRIFNETISTRIFNNEIERNTFSVNEWL